MKQEICENNNCFCGADKKPENSYMLHMTGKDQTYSEYLGIEKEHNDSFHQTVIRSPEWQAWKDEVRKRLGKHVENNSKIFIGVWDTSESEECDLISKEHFADFIKFIKKQ